MYKCPQNQPNNINILVTHLLARTESPRTNRVAQSVVFQFNFHRLAFSDMPIMNRETRY